MDPLHRTFSIEQCLGRGGFGEVYRAEMASPTGLSARVALKVLRRDVAPGGQAVQRLRDEGALLARLNHPTILRVHDLVILDGRVSLVTEYVDGDDLENCLRGADPIGLRALAEVLGQVAAALDAAYNAPVGDRGVPLKLVHRDVKPSNVRIGRHGEVKLLDFGIARSDEVTREARTVTDMMVGSPPYMAPERFLDGELRPASDVFALGAIGIERLIGARLFQAPVPVLASLAIDRNRYEAHLEERLARVPPDAPEPFVALCRRLLRYDPDARPVAAEVARMCEALADGLPGPTLARWCRDRTWAPPPCEVGELDGRVLSEDTLARTWDTDATEPPTEPVPKPAVAPSRSRPAPVRKRGRGLVVWLGGASVLSAAVGLPLAALALAVAVRTMWPQPGGPADPLPPLEAPEPAPRAPERPPDPEAPEPPPAVDDDPGSDAPSPEPPRSGAPEAPPAAAERPRTPDPEVDPPGSVTRPPAPEPDPPRLPAPEARVRVALAGDAVSVRLSGSGVELAQFPAWVAPGAYTVHAVLVEDGPEVAYPGVIAPGRPHTVTCRRRLQRCDITPDR